MSGSYGVNVCGYERYKDFTRQGWEHAKKVGTVLGPVHPVVGENIKILKQISGLDEVRRWGGRAKRAAIPMSHPPH